MGSMKNKLIEEQKGHYEDHIGEVAFNGGYLDVQLDGVTIATVSIARPYLMAERSSDSMAVWEEEFEDDEGNLYRAYTASAIDGVYWSIDIEPQSGYKPSDEILQDLRERLKILPVFTEEG